MVSPEFSRMLISKVFCPSGQGVRVIWMGRLDLCRNSCSTSHLRLLKSWDFMVEVTLQRSTCAVHLPHPVLVKPFTNSLADHTGTAALL